MLPLLVIPPIQPFHPRRIGLGFLSFPSSNSLISFPSCQLPPLWAHKETQAPYFQSLAASFPKNMGGYSFTFPILLSDSRLASFSSFDFPIPPFRASSCLLPLPPAHLRLSIFEFRVSNFVLQCKFIRDRK